MLRLGLAIAATIIVLDQWSKTYVLDYFLPAGAGSHLRVELLANLNLVLVWNRGVSFGLLSTGSPIGPYLLAAVAAVIAAGLGVWLSRIDQVGLAVALGLVIGGALGNVVDRLRFGAVVDYIDVHFAGWHWPAFNVADSSITIGVVALVLASFFESRPESET